MSTQDLGMQRLAAKPRDHPSHSVSSSFLVRPQSSCWTTPTAKGGVRRRRTAPPHTKAVSSEEGLSRVTTTGLFITNETVLAAVAIRPVGPDMTRGGLPPPVVAVTAEAGAWLRVRDSVSGAVRHQQQLRSHTEATCLVGHSETGDVWVGQASGLLTVFRLVGETLMERAECIHHHGGITGLALAPLEGSGRRPVVACVDERGVLSLWDASDYLLTASVTLKAGCGIPDIAPFNCVAGDREGVYVPGGIDTDGSACVALVCWEPNASAGGEKDWVARRQFCLPAWIGGGGGSGGSGSAVSSPAAPTVLSMALSQHVDAVADSEQWQTAPQGRRTLWAGLSNGMVVVWDADRGSQPLRLLQHHCAAVHYVACGVACDPRRAWTCSMDGKVALWDTTTYALLGELPLSYPPTHRPLADPSGRESASKLGPDAENCSRLLPLLDTERLQHHFTVSMLFIEPVVTLRVWSAATDGTVRGWLCQTDDVVAGPLAAAPRPRALEVEGRPRPAAPSVDPGIPRELVSAFLSEKAAMVATEVESLNADVAALRKSNAALTERNRILATALRDATAHLEAQVKHGGAGVGAVRRSLTADPPEGGLRASPRPESSPDRHRAGSGEEHGGDQKTPRQSAVEENLSQVSATCGQLSEANAELRLRLLLLQRRRSSPDRSGAGDPARAAVVAVPEAPSAAAVTVAAAPDPTVAAPTTGDDGSVARCAATQTTGSGGGAAGGWSDAERQRQRQLLDLLRSQWQDLKRELAADHVQKHRVTERALRDSADQIQELSEHFRAAQEHCDAVKQLYAAACHEKEVLADTLEGVQEVLENTEREAEALREANELLERSAEVLKADVARHAAVQRELEGHLHAARTKEVGWEAREDDLVRRCVVLQEALDRFKSATRKSVAAAQSEAEKTCGEALARERAAVAAAEDGAAELRRTLDLVRAERARLEDLLSVAQARVAELEAQHAPLSTELPARGSSAAAAAPGGDAECRRLEERCAALSEAVRLAETDRVRDRAERVALREQLFSVECELDVLRDENARLVESARQHREEAERLRCLLEGAAAVAEGPRAVLPRASGLPPLAPPAAAMEDQEEEEEEDGGGDYDDDELWCAAAAAADDDDKGGGRVAAGDTAPRGAAADDPGRSASEEARREIADAWRAVRAAQAHLHDQSAALVARERRLADGEAALAGAGDGPAPLGERPGDSPSERSPPGLPRDPMEVWRAQALELADRLRAKEETVSELARANAALRAAGAAAAAAPPPRGVPSPLSAVEQENHLLAALVLELQEELRDANAAAALSIAPPSPRGGRTSARRHRDLPSRRAATPAASASTSPAPSAGARRSASADGVAGAPRSATARSASSRVVRTVHV